MISNRLFFWLTILISVFLAPLTSNAQIASHFYLESDQAKIAESSDLFVNVYLDTNKDINAFDLSLSYVPDKINFVDDDNTGSIVSIWAGSPKEISPGLVSFSGGLTKPFSGTRGFLTKLHFHTLAAGESQISISANNVYLANGLGTKIKAESSDLVVTILPAEESSPNIVSPTTLQYDDSTPPEINLEVVRNLIDGTSLAVFQTSDHESGIKETEVRSRIGFSWSAWKPVENFSTLARGVWVVEARATNRAGLESLKRTYVWHEIWKETRTPLFTLLAFLLVGFAVYFHYRRVYNKYKNPYA